ncbi:MAG: zf-HC2 domain-containing protein [Phycisphaerae bacterium]
MGTCDNERRLSAYHDGELTGEERAAMEAHLRRCPQCAAALERLGRLSRLIQTAGRTEMPAPARARLGAAVEALPASDVGRLAKAGLAVAASVLMVCGVWLWQANGGDPADAIPVWETVAGGTQPTAAGTEEQLAQWIIRDLERTNGHD